MVILEAVVWAAVEMYCFWVAVAQEVERVIH